MKVVILAGGYGSRISEYTNKMPKPMIKLNKKPIIEHIIKYYNSFGFKDFIIAGGYKYKILKKYVDENKFFKKLKVNVVNTGENTLTGKRIFKLKKFLDNDENFHLTYGDGLSDVNLKNLTKFHIEKKSLLTLTAVRPPARFGIINLKEDKIVNFSEKPQVQEGWINGGFFVINRGLFKFLNNKNVMFEREPIKKICGTGKMYAYKHYSFWKCVDNKRDLDQFQKLFKNKKFFLNKLVK